MKIPYIMGTNFVTVMVKGETHTIGSDQPTYSALREAIRNKDWDQIPDLVNPARAVEAFGAGDITVRDNEVYYKGSVLRNGVTRRILQMVGEGFDAQPLMNFLTKLMSNPSATAVRELYDWLEGTHLPITEDGCFVAYKKVNNSYFDFYTGKVLNKPAELMTDADRDSITKPMNGVTVAIVDGVTTLSMPRNEVDDDRDRTCSQGLHFCSLSYLPNYHGGQGRILLVKINPADVVSIPSDYNYAKGRAWCYQIIGEHVGGETVEAFDTPVVTNQAQPVKSSRVAKVAPDTLVMGVDFGTEDRATMVKDLINQCAGRTGASRGADQAHMDGFDDAWDGRAVQLIRYTGSNMRDAVEYARGYFESYDRCQGNMRPVTTAAPVVPKGNPALKGYNQGRSDRAQGFVYDPHNPRSGFSGDDAARYAASYVKGWASVRR